MALAGADMVELPQIFGDIVSTAPILAVFVWFVLMMQREERGERDRLAAVANAERARLATEGIAERARLAAEATAERKQRDEDWRAFLIEQRTMTIAAIDTVSLRLQQLGNQIEAHDIRVQTIAKNVGEMKMMLGRDREKAR